MIDGSDATTSDQRAGSGSMHAADALAGMIDMGDALQLPPLRVDYGAQWELL